jgi:hypothetical protein
MKSRRTMKKRTEQLVREVSLDSSVPNGAGVKLFKRLFAW